MSSYLVLLKLRFKTANITAYDISKQYGKQKKPSNETLENIANAYRDLDGMEVVGAEWEYMPNEYSIYEWHESDDYKVKELFYHYEQDEIFGSYQNSRKEFEEDWNNGYYELNAFHCTKSHFNILEKL